MPQVFRMCNNAGLPGLVEKDGGRTPTSFACPTLSAAHRKHREINPPETASVAPGDSRIAAAVHRRGGAFHRLPPLESQPLSPLPRDDAQAPGYASKDTMSNIIIDGHEADSEVLKTNEDSIFPASLKWTFPDGLH